MQAPFPNPATCIPVIDEVLTVATERHQTGSVRVRIEPYDVVETVETASAQDSVVVERHAVGSTASERLAPWTDGDTLIVPIYEEEVVVQRRLILREEVHIVRRREVHTEPVEMRLRKERAVVERQAPDGTWVELKDIDSDRLADTTAPAVL